MANENHTTPRGRGALSALGWALTLVLIGLLVWVLVVVASPTLFGRQVEFPPGVARTAQLLGSEAATSARAILPLGKGLVGDTSLRSTSPRIVPTAGKAVSARTITFAYDGVKHSIKPAMASDVYWGARRSTRLLTELPGESNADWTSAYYHAFADDPAQKPAIDDVCAQLRAIRDRWHLGPDQYLELIAKYVQSIPYDWAIYKSGTGKQRFPVETLVDGKGLCGDKSVLLADLLSHEGYAAALLDFGPEKHMAVGIKGQGRTYSSSGFLFLETTSPCYVTDVPTEYTGGMKLQSEPVVVQIGDGVVEYSAADQIAKIVAVRESAQKAADRLYKDAKSQQLTNAEVTAINRKLNAAYNAQTSLRSNVVDPKGKSVGTFLDRDLALAWIDRNAWWL